MAELLQLTLSQLTIQTITKDRKKSVAKCTANIGPKVLKALNWTSEPEDWQTSISGGDTALAAHEVTFGMSGTLTDAISVKLDATALDGFSVTRVKTKGKRKAGTGFRHVLHFSVTFPGECMEKLEKYMMRAPQDKGTLAVKYSPQPVQSEITETAETGQGELTEGDE